MLSEKLSSTAQPRREHRHQRHGHLRSIPPCPHRNTRAPGLATRQSLCLTDNVVSIGPYPQLALGHDSVFIQRSQPLASGPHGPTRSGMWIRRSSACSTAAKPACMRSSTTSHAGSWRGRLSRKTQDRSDDQSRLRRHPRVRQGLGNADEQQLRPDAGVHRRHSRRLHAANHRRARWRSDVFAQNRSAFKRCVDVQRIQAAERCSMPEPTKHR